MAAPAGRILAILTLGCLLAACASSPAGRDEQAAAPRTDLAEVQRLAEAAYADGDWAAAETHYQQLVRATPQEGSFWFRLGNIFARTTRPDDAVIAYREALVRDAADGKAWFNMGVVQLRQAANSFLQMNLHVKGDDPFATQGLQAYNDIMDILGEPSAISATPGETQATEAVATTQGSDVDEASTAPAANSAPDNTLQSKDSDATNDKDVAAAPPVAEPEDDAASPAQDIETSTPAVATTAGIGALDRAPAAGQPDAADAATSTEPDGASDE